MTAAAVHMQRLAVARSGSQPRRDWIVDIASDKRAVQVAGTDGPVVLRADGGELSRHHQGQHSQESRSQLMIAKVWPGRSARS